jgi:cellulose synthase/poly-beta-1,6-N-acetylglucosamine synthase-like glycosyltransferase
MNVARKFKGVKVVVQKHAGPAVGRNRGVRHSRGSIILFTDSDCIPNRNWIRNMTKPFQNKEVVGVSGTYRTANNHSIVSRFVGYEIEDRHDAMMKRKSIDFVGTFSAGYKRDVFLKFGGFDENFQRASGEDTDLSFKISKAGGKIVFAPGAYVSHHHPERLWTMLKKKFWMGYWRILLYKKHRDKLFRHTYTPKSVFVEIAFLGAALLLLIAWSLELSSLLPAVAAFAIASLLTLPLSVKIFRKDRTVGLLSPGIILARDFAAGLGIAVGLLAFLLNNKRKQ